MAREYGESSRRQAVYDTLIEVAGAAAFALVAWFAVMISSAGVLVQLLVVSVALVVGIIGVLVWRRRTLRLSDRERQQIASALIAHPNLGPSRFLPVGDGGTPLTVADLLADSTLELPQEWKSIRDSTFHSGSLASRVDITLSEGGGPVLILGQPGVGKSFTAYALHRLLARRLDSLQVGSKLPILLDLALAKNRTSPGQVADLVPDEALDDWGIDRKKLNRLDRVGDVIWLLDGVDEFTLGEGGERRRRLRALESADVVTCRTDYWDVEPSTKAIDGSFNPSHELLGVVGGDPIRDFVSAYCERTGRPKRAVLDVLQDPSIEELIRRPLMLWMVVDVVGGAGEPATGPWSQSRLYREYTMKWLSREAAREASFLTWEDKDLLARLAARALFIQGRSPGSMSETTELVLTREALAREIESSGGPLLDDLSSTNTLSNLVEEAVAHTFLVRSDRSDLKYWFVHKSFLEFYVALDIIELLSNSESGLTVLERHLARPLPDPIIYFIREMLTAATLAGSQQSVISRNFERLIEESRDDRLRDVAVRQHAGNLLALVADARAVDYLEAKLGTEPNQFVRRGMIVGLAMHQGRRDVLDAYVQQLEHDPEAVAIQLGYSRVYHGDQVFKGEWRDDGTPSVDSTVAAQVDRILSTRNRERNRNIWPLTFFTLRKFLEDGRAWSYFRSHTEEYKQLASALRSSEAHVDEETSRQAQALLRALDLTSQLPE